VFKRRDQRPWARILTEWVYPRGGWTRAFQYVQHRLSRLPGTPESIARGIFVGALTAFTPFFGIHFVIAAVLAKMVRGNILAALIGTFVGNPLTYVPIALVSLEFGHFMLGTEMRGRVEDGLFHKFGGALGDLWHNIQAVFTHERAHWDELHIFYDDVFFPWMVGGISSRRYLRHHLLLSECSRHSRLSKAPRRTDAKEDQKDAGTGWRLGHKPLGSDSAQPKADDDDQPIETWREY